jgi:hypothetical protein
MVLYAQREVVLAQRAKGGRDRRAASPPNKRLKLTATLSTLRVTKNEAGSRSKKGDGYRLEPNPCRRRTSGRRRTRSRTTSRRSMQTLRFRQADEPL